MTGTSTTTMDADAALEFTVPPELSARAPAEARGLARDGIRMLVGRRDGPTTEHHRFADLPDLLRPGDLLVVNNSATLPAALSGRLPDGTPVAVHLSTAHPDPRGHHLVELRRPTSGAAASYPPGTSPARPGLTVTLPGGARAELTAPFTPRLWYARLHLPAAPPNPAAPLSPAVPPSPTDPGNPSRLIAYLARHGRAIRYGYTDRDWPIEAYQTVFAAEPGSSEMPSAARPFTARTVARLAARGVLVAPITLHTGVASPEAHEPPYAERYRVPGPTARLVGHIRAEGGRVIAVGTTAVRALESATGPDGRLCAADGWTELVITPERGVRTVDGLLTGWHEPQASHLLMLEAVAGRPLLERCYREALRHRYLWHEFGDVNLLLPD
ncbi:S-adenosylmethionine:tRNA ribosyltransferase-isomerase [Kitasatospora camelliae]|uniref:S-adenosylmethionine:tRNA ribosyltransferase-isomerase n=1 Tax=Kitasatospora camelliae TaxID=3156397 RepID=A0AAU8K5E9_9ACTN